jgi:hypothetical protein
MWIAVPGFVAVLAAVLAAEPEVTFPPGRHRRRSGGDG